MKEGNQKKGPVIKTSKCTLKKSLVRKRLKGHLGEHNANPTSTGL